MESEQVAALAAVVSAAISIVAIIIAVKSQSDQRSWQSDQASTQRRVEKDLQDRQHEIEKQLQDRQNKWQVVREDEVRKIEDNLRKPQPVVQLNMGLEAVRGIGVVNTWLNVDCANTGLVQVYFSEFGVIMLPDNKKMSIADLVGREHIRLDFDPAEPLQPGNRVTTKIQMRWLKDQLKKNGYSGTLHIRGLYSDKIGGQHISKVHSIDLDSDSVAVVPIQ